jgi:hypothetical protein
MEKFINSCSCPTCNNPLPFIGYARWKQTRYFPYPRFKCPNCGAISEMKVCWEDAIVAWPLTFFVVLGMANVFNSSFFASYRCESSGIDAIVFGAIAGLVIGLGGRRGCRLYNVAHDQADEK